MSRRELTLDMQEQSQHTPEPENTDSGSKPGSVANRCTAHTVLMYKPGVRPHMMLSTTRTKSAHAQVKSGPNQRGVVARSNDTRVGQPAAVKRVVVAFSQKIGEGRPKHTAT